jgi:polyvinyl alcohol dehydrogenase (cytochrome)
MPTTRRLLSLLLVLPVILAGCMARPAAEPAVWISDDAPIIAAIELNGVAEAQRRAQANQHADPSASIHSQNVDRMQLAWTIDTGGNFVTHTPLVEDGRLYFADWGGYVYAADARSGQVLWKRRIEQPRKHWPWHGFCGTGALGEGMLFQASAEGNAFALDARTGRVIWKKRIVRDTEAGNAGAIRYHNGLLFIGVSSVEEVLTARHADFEPTFRGKVIALDARNGRKVWERPLVQPPHNGVAVWSGFCVDDESGLLFFTTGNNYTGQATELSDAIIAVYAASGEIRWSRQMTANDVWTMREPIGPGYDFAAAPQLFEARVDGRVRRLVGAGQKSGVYWVLDRDSGQVLWNTTAGYGHIGGGIHAEASIGEDGRIYLWGNNAFAYTDPERHAMDVMAVDSGTGRYLWSNLAAQPAGVTSAGFLSSDVYLVGSLDGRVRAYQASDGKQLWTSPSTAPIGSSLWVHDDMLYFGTGVPAAFGGREGGGGLHAFGPVPGIAPARDDAPQFFSVPAGLSPRR